MTHCPRCGKDNPAEIHTCTPLALKLADLLEPCCLTIGDAQQAVAAAELRRLHELNEDLYQQGVGFIARIEKDEALLRQALDALDWIVTGRGHDTIETAHAAIRTRLGEAT